MEFQDQLGRLLNLKFTPRRIISLVPSQTELIVDLGLEDQLVGVTKFCVHPSNIRKDKTIVGGTKAVKIEKIKALDPDIILCNKEENTKSMIEELEQYAAVHVSDIGSFDNALTLINQYGAIFNQSQKADSLVTAICQKKEQYQLNRKVLNGSKVAYFMWKNPWMVAAGDTFINSMLFEAGFQNVYITHTRYPEIDLNNPILKKADFLLLSTEPYPFKSTDVAELKSIFTDKEIKVVDGEMFSWYGSRLLKSFEYFSGLF